MRPLGRGRAARIVRDQFPTLMEPFENVMEEDRMRFARVRSPQENDVGILRFQVRVRAATRTENRRQTDDARGVSSSVATIDVVRSKNGSRELRREKVHLVRRSRATEDAERVGPMLGDDAPKAVGRRIERFVPRRRCQYAVAADHRFRQPFVWCFHGNYL